MDIPKNLYSKQIISYIKELIDFQDAKDFYSLKDIHQEKLISMGISALDGDIDIVLSHDANMRLAKYLLNPTRDTEIELTNATKKAAHDQFAGYFDQLIREESFEIGHRGPYSEVVNGQVMRW